MTNFTNKTIPVVFAINNGFSAQAATAIQSIITNTRMPEIFKFYILSSDISEKNIRLFNRMSAENNIEINFVDMKKYVKTNLDAYLAKSASYCYITNETYYRFYLADIFKEYDKIIYLDADIIVLHDLSEMFNINIGEFYAGVVDDAQIKKYICCPKKYKSRMYPELNHEEYFNIKLKKKTLEYFNAGILLLNLKALRENNITEKLWEFLEENSPLDYQDQDVLNAVFENNVKFIDVKWNTMIALPSLYKFKLIKKDKKIWQNAYKNPYIIHYNGKEKPWEFNPKYKYKYNYIFKWWDEYVKTPFYNHETDFQTLKQIKLNHKFYKLIRVKNKFNNSIIVNPILTKIFNLIECSPTINTKEAYDKFGLLKYEYKNLHSGYQPEYLNIGDYIQSLAAKQYLPETSPLLIDRDCVSDYDGENVNLITNGWYSIFKGNYKFSDKINPLFVAFQLSNPEKISDETIKYLKRHEPIGCRDYATRNFLMLKGVKAYFSSCLTTTLDKEYKVSDNERENKIIFCDYKPDFTTPNAIDRKLSEIIKKYKDFEIEYTSNAEKLGLAPEQCFDIAKNLLNKYAKAKLVITTRIHCALPCLALGTPVILVVPKKFDKKRFYGISQFLNILGKNKQNKFTCKIKFDRNGFVINDSKYLSYANRLKKTVNEFIKNCKNCANPQNALSVTNLTGGGGAYYRTKTLSNRD